jgi:Mn-dependent DtxR family transcriptional regulator
MNSDIVEQYLLQKYHSQGNTDFYFSSHKLARQLSLSAQTIGAYLSDLREDGIVEHYNRIVWLTTLNKKEPVKTPFWKVWLNNRIVKY